MSIIGGLFVVAALIALLAVPCVDSLTAAKELLLMAVALLLCGLIIEISIELGKVLTT